MPVFCRTSHQSELMPWMLRQIAWGKKAPVHEAMHRNNGMPLLHQDSFCADGANMLSSLWCWYSHQVLYQASNTFQGNIHSTCPELRHTKKWRWSHPHRYSVPLCSQCTEGAGHQSDDKAWRHKDSKRSAEHGCLRVQCLVLLTPSVRWLACAYTMSFVCCCNLCIYKVARLPYFIADCANFWFHPRISWLEHEILSGAGAYCWEIELVQHECYHRLEHSMHQNRSAQGQVKDNMDPAE